MYGKPNIVRVSQVFQALCEGLSYIIEKEDVLKAVSCRKGNRSPLVKWGHLILNGGAPS